MVSDVFYDATIAIDGYLTSDSPLYHDWFSDTVPQLAKVGRLMKTAQILCEWIRECPGVNDVEYDRIAQALADLDISAVESAVLAGCNMSESVGWNLQERHERSRRPSLEAVR